MCEWKEIETAAAVRIWKPESQSVKAMGADRFKASIRDVEIYIAGLVGATREQLAIGAEAA